MCVCESKVNNKNMEKKHRTAKGRHDKISTDSDGSFNN